MSLKIQPFRCRCGGEVALRYDEAGVVGGRHYQSDWHMVCLKPTCHADSGSCETEEEARSRWLRLQDSARLRTIVDIVEELEDCPSCPSCGEDWPWDGGEHTDDCRWSELTAAILVLVTGRA